MWKVNNLYTHINTNTYTSKKFKGHHFYHIQFTSQIMTAKEIHHTHQKNNKKTLKLSSLHKYMSTQFFPLLRKSQCQLNQSNHTILGFICFL